MAYKRVRARSSKSAKNKAKGKRTVVSKVNYINGTKRKGLKTYGVYTHKKKKKQVEQPQNGASTTKPSPNQVPEGPQGGKGTFFEQKILYTTSTISIIVIE